MHAVHHWHSGRNQFGLVLQEKEEQYVAAFFSLMFLKEAEGTFISFEMGIFPISIMTFLPPFRHVHSR